MTPCVKRTCKLRDSCARYTAEETGNKMTVECISTEVPYNDMFVRKLKPERPPRMVSESLLWQCLCLLHGDETIGKHRLIREIEEHFGGQRSWAYLKPKDTQGVQDTQDTQDTQGVQE